MDKHERLKAYANAGTALWHSRNTYFEAFVPEEDFEIITDGYNYIGKLLGWHEMFAASDYVKEYVRQLASGDCKESLMELVKNNVSDFEEYVLKCKKAQEEYYTLHGETALVSDWHKVLSEFTAGLVGETRIKPVNPRSVRYGDAQNKSNLKKLFNKLYGTSEEVTEGETENE